MASARAGAEAPPSPLRTLRGRAPTRLQELDKGILSEIAAAVTETYLEPTQKLRLDVRVDSEILGGLTLKIGDDRFFNFSSEARLVSLERRLRGQ